IGLAQLERAEELVGRKRQIFGWYADRLRGLSGIQLNPESADTRNSYWMTTLVLDPALELPKEHVMAELSDRGIDSRPFFHPLSSIPACRGLAAASRAREINVNAYRISPYGVNLPSALSLTEEDVDVVCRAIQEIISRSEMRSRRMAS
ncbi:MAG: DegT/DnrJ/EryC1/StrS family aminotransferase, partial [Planctomycetaceae bacterium]|nr:DegT/DnrJ/EryC1/StrS family aminotransferase [Planctomycetaceae bacterium]